MPAFAGIKWKRANRRSPFLPQIYHKLNLLMLWWDKYKSTLF